MNRRKAIQQAAYLLGGAISASVIASAMSACQPTGAPDWTPQFLTKSQATTIGEIAETILPETDTLGAKSLHLTEEECQSFTGKNFVDCSPEEQQKFLLVTEKKGLTSQEQTGKKSFLSKIKELVLVGYFTSEYAITELMNYNPIPQKFEGCVEAEIAPKIQVGIEGRSA